MRGRKRIFKSRDLGKTYFGVGKTSESFRFRRSFNDFLMALTFIFVSVLSVHQLVSLIFNNVIAIDPPKISRFKLCNGFENEFSQPAAH